MGSAATSLFRILDTLSAREREIVNESRSLMREDHMSAATKSRYYSPQFIGIQGYTMTNTGTSRQYSQLDDRTDVERRLRLHL